MILFTKQTSNPSFCYPADPSEVRNLMANSTSSTEIFVSWEIPKEENGILGDYLITWDDGSGDNQSAEVNTTSFLIEGLVSCVLYNITVKAQTGAGYGEESYIDATTETDGDNHLIVF